MKKTVVVTGASGCVGQRAVSALLEGGYIVVACARDLTNLNEESVDLFCYEGDLTNANERERVAKEIKSEHKSIFSVVNCMGIAQGGSFLMSSFEDLQRVFDVNYFSVLAFTQSIVRKMIKNKQGVVVNIASTAGVLSQAGTLAYGGSKAALIHASKVMSAELGVFNIRVNAIAPAVLESPMKQKMDAKSLSELDERSRLKGEIHPDEVVSMILYLLGDDAKNITGQVIALDRGASV